MTVQSAARLAPAPQTPALSQARPETLGLSSARLEKMSEAFRREIDKGTVPGATMLVARRGQVGYFEAFGRQGPGAAAPMARDSLFRIFSMTKPIVSLGIMMLLEDGHLLLSDPLEKYIPEFAEQKVGVDHHGQLELVPRTRSITLQDLLRHTSGITYDHTGNGPVQQMYQASRLRSRKISNAEHAAMVAGLPLMSQPGAEWNYSRSTDILGRVIEVVSGKTLLGFEEQKLLKPLGMTSTGHASRSLANPAGVSTHNVTLSAGAQSVEALMSATGKGVIVTSMFGPSVNNDTGDWSAGASGFWFENGVIAYPVNEITVAGNLIDIYARLVPASDLEIKGTFDTPSLLIEALSVGGK